MRVLSLFVVNWYQECFGVTVDSPRQSIVYNRYATPTATNPVFLGFSGYQNILKEIINSFLQKNYKNAYIKKSPYFKGYRGCGKLSDGLEIISYATHIQQVCNKYIDMYRTFFSSDTGKCPFFARFYKRCI